MASGVAVAHTPLARLFNSLAGTWILVRELQSANASEPSGFCHGTARFSPREPSPVVGDGAGGGLETATAELLYEEHGQLQASSAAKVSFSKKYIWRLSQDDDDDDDDDANSGTGSISLWFTKPGSETIDYLFHKIDLDPGKTVSVSHSSPDLLAVEGSGGHVCVDDFYHSTYTFHLSGQGEQVLSSFQTVHEVRGPKKEQLITTQFARA